MYFTPLLTDFYELTMAQGYYLNAKDTPVVFDMFFRRQPFNSGFAVFAGLEELINRLVNLRFHDKDISYLRKQKVFKDEFLDFLKGYRFSGDLYAMEEGTIVFPGEPLIRIHTSMIEAQLIESLLLNQINFQTLIATKAARIYNATGQGKVMEFGLRRAQGIDGALSASRAAYIGGCTSSSNTLAGQMYGIPVAGTMAHSWIMAFDNEVNAFRAYADIYPDNPVFLIDTYDTLGSGIRSAIVVGQELKARGKRIGVRLDSGDLQYLSQRVRERLDAAGLEDATIVVSNDIDEEIAWQLRANDAPVDFWGIGTQLVTGGCDSSLTGVYKLAARMIEGELKPVLKLSDNPEKITNPGVKQVHRFYDSQDSPLGDLICLEEEKIPQGFPVRFNHPMYRYKHHELAHHARSEPLLVKQIDKGVDCSRKRSLKEIREKVISDVARLDPTHRRLLNPHIYKVSLSTALSDMKFGLIDELTDD